MKSYGAGEISRFSENAVKLRQQRATLEELDAQADILARVPEDEIEGEIERSDLFEENARLAIANIDNAFSIPEVVSHTAQPNVSGMADLGRTGSGSSSPSAAVANSSVSTPNKTHVRLPK